MKALLACLLILATALASAAGLPDRVRFSVAIERGDVAQAREWLAAGLPPDFEGSLIGSGLMIGAWEGSIPMMALFLSYGANVNAVNTHGETALLHASWKGHLDAVRWLIESNLAPVETGQLQIPLRRFDSSDDLEHGRRVTIAAVDLCHQILNNTAFAFSCGETADLFDGIYLSSDRDGDEFVHLLLASDFIALCNDLGGGDAQPR